MNNHAPVLCAIGIGGSPSPNARSGVLLSRVLEHLGNHAIGGEVLDLLALPADALLACRRDESEQHDLQIG